MRKGVYIKKRELLRKRATELNGITKTLLSLNVESSDSE